MKAFLTYLILLACILTGCTGLRHIPENEVLYTGGKVELVKAGRVSDQKKALQAVKAMLRPVPNKKFLGNRLRLWLYYKAGVPKKEKGFRHWLRTKAGEPPVYLSSADPALMTKAIDSKLYNMGFLDSYSEASVHERKKGRTAYIEYRIMLYEPYRINKVIYPKPTDSLNANLAASGKRSLLLPEKRYDLDNLLLERARIEDRLKRRGFYYFNQEYLVFKMDTSLGTRKLDLYLAVKDETPEKSKLVYRLAAVNVYPDYKTGKDTLRIPGRLIDSVNYYDETFYIRDEPIIRSVFLKNGAIYDRRKQQMTSSRLNGLGVFKLVNVRITDADTSVPGWLNANIFLSPMSKRSMTIEMQGVSKSNNFIGPALTLSIRNRNAFKGAELIIYNLRGSFETQFNGLYKGRYTYEFNPRVEVYVPRFMVPFRLKKNSLFPPRTKYIFDYSFLSRVGYFDLNSAKFSFGYKWKEKITIDHDLSLLTINYFKINNASASFNELVRNNILLRRRFDEQLIWGISYSFVYNGQVKHRDKNQVYFNFNIESAGNTLSLVKRLSGENPSADNPSTLFGIRFAQFGKADIDVRDYVRFGQEQMVAMRFIAGWGLPYGNSSTMPYIKQFFSGGAYSVRGFQAYSIGPGTYAPPDSLKNIFFLQQGGEIKLEGNIEYRFPILGVLKGAVFADAGNVWLNNPNEEIPGGEFVASRALSELAVGVGTGLRLDLSFFVLRLDLGIPIRKPWLPAGERWVHTKIDYTSPQWRNENLVFNLAFGYPF